jgi:hypothetical protein
VPVEVEAGETSGGQRVLRFRFAGTTTNVEWDGSERDAEELVDDLAENAALNVGGDYWVHGGGWKEWNGTPEPPG